MASAARFAIFPVCGPSRFEGGFLDCDERWGGGREGCFDFLGDRCMVKRVDFDPLRNSTLVVTANLYDAPRWPGFEATGIHTGKSIVTK